MQDEGIGAGNVNKYLNHYFGHNGLTLVPVEDAEKPGVFFIIKRGDQEAHISGLDERSKDIGRLILLTALAPYQVDEEVVNSFTSHIIGDDKLIGALAWGSFTAARRIGTWLS